MNVVVDASSLSDIEKSQKLMKWAKINYYYTWRDTNFYTDDYAWITFLNKDLETILTVFDRASVVNLYDHPQFMVVVWEILKYASDKTHELKRGSKFEEFALNKKAYWCWAIDNVLDATLPSNENIRNWLNRVFELAVEAGYLGETI